MKKKILAVVLAGVMAMSMLTACGGSAETAETTETADVETTEDAASDEACSDETFATLQDNYAVMVDAYNQVKDLYESDEIAGDAEIEDLMNQAADVINEMGEISQDTITEADAETLNGAMMDILDGLSGIVDAMEVLVSFPECATLLVCQLIVRSENREIELIRIMNQFIFPFSHLLATPADDGPFIHG